MSCPPTAAARTRRRGAPTTRAATRPAGTRRLLRARRRWAGRGDHTKRIGQACKARQRFAARAGAVPNHCQQPPPCRAGRRLTCRRGWVEQEAGKLERPARPRAALPLLCRCKRADALLALQARAAAAGWAEASGDTGQSERTPGGGNDEDAIAKVSSGRNTHTHIYIHAHTHTHSSTHTHTHTHTRTHTYSLVNTPTHHAEAPTQTKRGRCLTVAANGGEAARPR
jgi:hypothetical protein